MPSSHPACSTKYKQTNRVSLLLLPCTRRSCRSVPPALCCPVDDLAPRRESEASLCSAPQTASCIPTPGWDPLEGLRRTQEEHQRLVYLLGCCCFYPSLHMPEKVRDRGLYRAAQVELNKSSAVKTESSIFEAAGPKRGRSSTRVPIIPLLRVSLWKHLNKQTQEPRCTSPRNPQQPARLWTINLVWYFTVDVLHIQYLNCYCYSS